MISGVQQLTVGELRRNIADLPDDLPVFVSLYHHERRKDNVGDVRDYRPHEAERLIAGKDQRGALHISAYHEDKEDREWTTARDERSATRRTASVA